MPSSGLRPSRTPGDSDSESPVRSVSVSSLQQDFSARSFPRILSTTSGRPQRKFSWDASMTPEKLLQMHYSFHQRKSNPHKVQCLWMYAVISHQAFKFIVHLLIVLSAVQMGLAADFEGGSWDIAWTVCEQFFTAVFFIEMIMKLIALGVDYFYDWWNRLDFLVAWSSIVDSWILPLIIPADDTPAFFKWFRLIRLLRILKMLRVVPELMLVWEGIVASLRSMFWVFSLLAVIIYAVGIYCVEAIGSESAGYKGHNTNDADIYSVVVDSFNNYLYFGSVSRSMVSLFSVILLAEWSPVVRPIWEKQPAIVLVFIGLVILTTFGVLNVIIGVVVERTTTAMNQLRADDIAIRKRVQMEAFQTISDVMFALDADSDKKISKQEMEDGAKNDQLLELLSKVDFPHGFTYGEFHSMLDQDGSGFLSQSEFINGMFRLVYNDDFQRDCVSQLTMGQIKANQFKLHREMKEHIDRLFGSVKLEINQLRSDMGLGPSVVVGPLITADEGAQRTPSTEERLQKVASTIQKIPNNERISKTRLSSRRVNWETDLLDNQHYKTREALHLSQVHTLVQSEAEDLCLDNAKPLVSAYEKDGQLPPLRSLSPPRILGLERVKASERLSSQCNDKSREESDSGGHFPSNCQRLAPYERLISKPAKVLDGNFVELPSESMSHCSDIWETSTSISV